MVNRIKAWSGSTCWMMLRASPTRQVKRLEQTVLVMMVTDDNVTEVFSPPGFAMKAARTELVDGESLNLKL